MRIHLCPDTFLHGKMNDVNQKHSVMTSKIHFQKNICNQNYSYKLNSWKMLGIYIYNTTKYILDWRYHRIWKTLCHEVSQYEVHPFALKYHTNKNVTLPWKYHNNITLPGSIMKQAHHFILKHPKYINFSFSLKLNWSGSISNTHQVFKNFRIILVECCIFQS